MISITDSRSYFIQEYKTACLICYIFYHILCDLAYIYVPIDVMYES